MIRSTLKTISPDTRAKLKDGLAARWDLNHDETLELRELCDNDEYLADLLVISGLLSALFRDESVEREWLRERRAVFDGLPAMMLILDGAVSLRRVRQAVEHMSGQ